MIEFDMGGLHFRAAKLDAIQQFHVSRKIAPLIPPLLPVFLEFAKGKGKDLKPGAIMEELPKLAPLLQPFADSIASLPDDAAEFVITTCLSVVRRQQGDIYSPVWNASAKAIMFDDMDLGLVLPIVVRIIIENLGPFIAGLLTSQRETEGKSPAG